MIRQPGQWFAAICAFSCLCGATEAAEGGNEYPYFEEFPVVLTASRLKQPQSESPNAMTVIDRAMIKASGARTIVEIFRLVPGMYVGYATGNTPIVSYHGTPEMYARRMQVLVDGRSIYLQPFVGVTWTDIPINLDDIERIEVVRGPAAAAYGANSLQGVINIITNDPVNKRSNRVAISQGNGGISDASARLSHAGEQLSYRLTVSHTEDAGSDFAPMNDGIRSNQINFRGNLQLDNENYIDMQLGYSNGTLAQGFNEQNPFKVRDPYRNISSLSDFQQIEWHRTTSSESEFKVSYHHTAKSYQDSSLVTDKDNYQTHRHELGFQHILTLNDVNRLVWGANLRYESSATTILFQPAKSLQANQLFVNDEWRIHPSLLMNAGAMLENDGWGNHNVSPRVSLNYHMSPEHTVRLGTSVAYRTPSMVEYGANSTYTPGTNNNLAGNPNLRPEKVVSREIGYLGEFKDIGLSLDSRIYEDRISDFIFLDPQIRQAPTPNEVLWGFNNQFALKYQGVESTMKYRSPDSSLNVSLNYVHQRVSCLLTGQLTSPYRQQFPYKQLFFDRFDVRLHQLCAQEYALTVPSDSGSILVSKRFADHFTASAVYYQQEPTQILLSTQPQSRMRRVDLRFGYDFGLSGKPGSGEVALTIQNAFQDNYSEYVDFAKKIGFIGNRRAWLTGALEF
jgi:iron complex outermembrane receptor protein